MNAFNLKGDDLTDLKCYGEAQARLGKQYPEREDRVSPGHLK
jgi:hypothetical protein